MVFTCVLGDYGRLDSQFLVLVSNDVYLPAHPASLYTNPLAL